MPESAFETALESIPPGERNSQPEWLQYLEGASTISNDPWTAGVIANNTYPEDLAGRYWIVAKDPGMAGGQGAQGGEATQGGDGIIITKDYRLAIIDLNIPKSVWFGAGSRAVRRPNSNLAMGRCVGEEKVCVATGGGTPCGSPAYCGETLYLEPSQLTGWFGSLSQHGQKPLTSSVQAAGLLPQIACLPPRLRECGNSNWGPTIEINSSSRFDSEIPGIVICGGSQPGRQVSGTIPAKECTYAGFGGIVIAGATRANSSQIPFSNCEGRCFACENSNGAVDSSGRPRFCNLLKPVAGGGLCQADQTQRQVDQLNAYAQWVAHGATETGWCDAPNSHGVRACVSCSDGACKTTVSVAFVRPNQTVAQRCNAPPCLLGSVVSVAQGASPLGEVTVLPASSSQSAAAPATKPTTGVARTLDTVDALPALIPQISAGRKHPIADGQIRDEVAADTTSEKPDQMVAQQPLVALDPVSLMAGSLEVSHTDLSFAGAVRTLEFSRHYSSQGYDRSELGSNWAHNWDIRVVPLRHENLPDGVDPFCAGTPEDITCVMLRAGNSGKLYMRDRRDGLFKPQAGSFSTLMKGADGWYLRGPDFHVQRFDTDGYLVYDSDRFGNAFKLEYELNAWGQLDEALCPNAVLRLDRQPGSWVDAMGLKYAASSLPCTLLSGLVGRTKPMVKSSVQLDSSNFNLTIPNQPPPSSQLLAARDLLFASQQGGVGNASVWGQRKKRVKRVFEVNDSAAAGRALEFTYWPDSDTAVLAGSSLRRAGLLQKVTGPAGAKVEFNYVAAPVPQTLNEALLSSVVRSDSNASQPAGVIAGPTRTYSFTYSNPAVSGTMMTATQIADIRARYERYFVATRGCAYQTYDNCGNPLVPAFSGISTDELDRRVDAFLSDVADNIITINAPNETVETRYLVDPLSLSFDKVTAQRWGSSRATPSPSQTPNWATTLPEATLAYAEEGPEGTDSFLPSTFATRYGYEDLEFGIAPASDAKHLLLAPNSGTGPTISVQNLVTQGAAAASTTDGGVIKPCTPAEEARLRTWLPGYRKMYEYYPLTAPTPPAPSALTNGLLTPGVDLEMTLRRSRLSCGQLAEAQTWDAMHNDLQTVFTARLNDAGLYEQSSFAGRRPEMNLNANRICAWTKYVDRDGAEHLYGFNYHGRPLVDGVLVDGAWRIAETLYNADGNVISQRSVTQGSTPWATNAGDTRYGYVEGQIIGNSFQEPSPWYWSQRGNVITVLERSRTGAVTEEIEGTHSIEQTQARYTEFFYEPLFGQVAKVITGDVTAGPGPVRRVQRTTDLLYDYQECAASDPNCLKPLLENAQQWGAQFPAYPDGGVITTSNPLSVALQYGDLNGDNQTGAPARGTLARVVTTGGAADAGETSLYRFSAHGKPYFIQTPDGTVSTMEYLPFGALSGAGGENERGPLARVRVLRERSIPSMYGPTAPCLNLHGPYQWLLPSSCGNTGLSSQLQTQAGLSAAIADEIEREATAGSAVFANTTTFAYSELGVPSKVVHADGSETRYTRDVDGRVREEAFYENSATLHSRTVITRNLQGQPTRTQRLSRMGVDLGSVWQDWDEEGRLLFECAEASPGGCVVSSHGSVPADGASRTLWYSKDGRLSSEMDSEGTYTHYTRDARGWVTLIRRKAPTPVPPQVPEPDRLTVFEWSNQGNLLTQVDGSGAAVRREVRTWDGFGRLSAVSVSSSSNPQQAPYRATAIRHSRRDVVSSVETVGNGSNGQTSWATHSIRDDFGRVLEQWTNGQRTLQVWRKPGGRVWKSQALGSGPRFMAHDEFGRVVFEQIGQTGSVKTVQVAPSDLRFEGVARIRNERGLKTNNVERSLSALGGVLSETELGFDGTSSPPSRVSSFALDDSDYVTGATDAVNVTSEYVRDLLGRPVSVRVPVSPGVMKTTEYRYNNRGQLTRITEPRGSSFGYTTQTYTGFGEPRTRTVPGGTTATPNDVVQTWTYDVLGRMVSEDVGPARLRYSYANDRVWRINNQTEQVLREFAYDGLGRLTESTHYNRGLTGLVADVERPVVSTFSYDTLGRRVSETSRVGTRTVRSTASNWLVTGGGWRRNTTRADGASQVELFDTMGRLSSMSRPWTGRQSEWRYEGELEAMELHDTATTQFQRTLEYDGLNQLMANAYNTASTVYATALLRDRAGRVMSANRVFSQPGQADSKAWRGYKYQEGGALEKVMELDDSVPTAGLNPTNTTWGQVQALGQAKSAAQYDYTRDVEGSVLSVDRVDIAGQAPRFEAPARQRGYQMEWYKLDGSGNGAMTHDGAGRVTAEFGRTYTYDDFHSLVRAGAASGSNAQGFQYDAVGRLIAVRRGTAGWPVEEELAYDGTQMVAAWNGAGVATWSAVWGQGVDNLISVKPGVDGAEVMALKDGRGSVVGYYQAEATPQGLLATADYTPEGRVTSRDWVTGTTCTETGSTQCPRLGGLPFGFHGAYKSPAHGLLYFRNRWYSAEAGQWLTQDPLGEVDSVNLYAFNRFDSVNFIDPFGLEGQGAAVTASNDGAIANDHVPVNDVNWECAASGQNCPKTPPRTPLKPAPASGAAAGPAAKADDEVDARGYMREEAKNDRRNAGRGGMVADAVVQSMLSQVKQPQRKRVVLVLMGKKIDSADKKSEFYRKHMGSVIKNFEAKVLDAIVHINIANSVERKGLMGEDLQITQTGDVIVSVPYDGTAPKLPPGVTASDVGEVVYFGHGAYNAPKILPAGDGTKGVTPKEFAGQLSSMGLGDVERVVILGCEAQENGFADGLKSEMPGSDVWGATGFVQPNYETDAKGRALPDSSIFLDSEIYHAK